MKTVLIIYVISWIIILAFYLHQARKRYVSLPWESRTPWYYYLVAVATAPLIVLVMPYILWERIKEKKERELRIKEIERQEKEKERKRAQAESIFKEVSSEQENQCGPGYIATAQSLHQAVREKAYSAIQKVLDKMTIQEGYSLCVEECSQSGHGDESKLYVTKKGPEHNYNVFTGALRFEDSCEGAWQAYLLYQLKYSLPLWWHANYNKRFYLFEAKDTAHVFHFSKNCNVVLNQTDEELSPEVYGKDERYFITCCYWSDFGGLIRERARIELREGQLIECLVFSSEEILPYQAPIRF